MTEEVRIRRASAFLSRAAGRGLLLANPERVGVEWLSPSASVVWDALAEPGTQEDVVRRVADAVGQVPDQVQAGVGALLRRLRVRGLVVDEPPPQVRPESARS